jgi:uncharacterized protein (TIGR00730 family)
MPTTNAEAQPERSAGRRTNLERVCVFTGSRPGARPAYATAAACFGRVLAARGSTLVYGGGMVGLMGILADAALDAGGDVIGVIPSWLDRKEIAHRALRDLRVVGSMHERKAQMADLAQAFVAMPGGFGTYDELFEILTWAQIGLHQKPIGLLDVEGYFEPLRALVDHGVREGFVAPEHKGLFVVDGDPARLLEGLERFAPPPLGQKWDVQKT